MVFLFQDRHERFWLPEEVERLNIWEKENLEIKAFD